MAAKTKKLPKKDKYNTIRSYTIEEFAKASGVSLEAMRIKAEMVKKIRSHCEKHGISQRKLASMVPGLQQERVSNIYRQEGAGTSIDKLVAIAHALKLKVELKLSEAA